MDHGILPGAGGVLDQDAALWEDVKLCIALILDAQERNAPAGTNGNGQTRSRDWYEGMFEGDPLQKGGARLDLWGS
jgi:hypothetical protein